MKIYTKFFILGFLTCAVMANASQKYDSLLARRPQTPVTGQHIDPLFRRIVQEARRLGKEAAENARLNKLAYAKACIYVGPLLLTGYAALVRTATPT